MTITATSCSTDGALQDGLCKAGYSRDVPIPFQLPSFYCGQEIFIGPNGSLESVVDLFVDYMVLVTDAKDLSIAPHFHGLYSSL